jgi:hypothetical protein
LAVKGDGMNAADVGGDLDTAVIRKRVRLGQRESA